MKVIVVGCGKIGYAIAKKLSDEKEIDVTMVDSDPDIIDSIVESIDIMSVNGNGLHEKTLIEAGVPGSDLLVAVTNADEVNILCCIMAKHLGVKHTIARIRNPEYAFEFQQLWKELGIDVVINPEMQSAGEISRLLRYPAASGLDTFVGGRVELVSLRVSEAPDYFVGKSLASVISKKMEILLAVVERNREMLIPGGDFVFETQDIIRILGRPPSIMHFLSHIKKRPEKPKEITIIGGSRIAYYLAELLNRQTLKANIKIIEKDKEKCERLSESLRLSNRRCLVIHGDGTNEEFLLSENIDQADAVISLTDRDEENVVISLYSMRIGVKKVITKVNHINQDIIKSLGLDSIATPHDISSDFVVRHTKRLMGARGNNIRTMYKVLGNNENSITAIEFHVNKKAGFLDVPIMDLHLKKEMLIGCIVRKNQILIPSGETRIQVDDDVVVFARNAIIRELSDILTGMEDILVERNELAEFNLR